LNKDKSIIALMKESWIKIIAIIVIMAAFGCSLWVNFGLRLPVEAGNWTVGLVVDYDELKRIADSSQNIEFRDMARKASLAGATGIVVRERILAEWEVAGDILVFTGGQLNFQLEALYGELAGQSSAGLTINPEKTYILTRDPLVYDQIYSSLEAKRRYPESFQLSDYMGIATHLHSSERAYLGMGFPMKQLEDAAAERLYIIPRLRSWEPVTLPGLTDVFSRVAQIPNLAAVGFHDSGLPGDTTDSVLLDNLRDAIASLNVPLVSFEFFDQNGLPAVAARLDNTLLRVHAIPENELHRYPNLQDAIGRYVVAVKERNIRYVYLRFPGLINPAAVMESSMELITDTREGLEDEGFIIGKPVPIRAAVIPFPILFFLGIGVLAAGGWLIALGGEKIVSRKWKLPYALLVLFGFICWAGVLMVQPLLGRKLMALAASIVFPGLALVLVLLFAEKHPRGKKSIIRTLLQMGVISAITLVGAFILSALLSEQRFMLKFDEFMGVKISHVIPLIFVPCVLWLREKNWYNTLSGTAKDSVRFWQLGVFIILAAALALYILRTGNDALGPIPDWERTIRLFLNRTIGARPRTTEFLIGHPMMMVLLYYGYRFNMFPVLLIALMGQISLINTYAHIHTPLALSLQRSFNGGWIGVIIGLAGIVLLEVFFRLARKIKASYTDMAVKE